MLQEIRKIPPAPREVRWRAVLWHRWPIALVGFVFAVYGGVFTLMLYFAAGGRRARAATARTARSAEQWNNGYTAAETTEIGNCIPGKRRTYTGIQSKATQS